MSIDVSWNIDIQALTDAGIELPDEYNEIHRRMSVVLLESTEYRDKLTAAVCDPSVSVSDEEIARLRGLAITEADTGRDIADAVTRKGYQELKRIYAGIAGDVWSQLAAEFNLIATKYVEAVNTIDPSLDMAEVFSKPKKLQDAWTNGNSLASDLDALVPALRTAAKLAGFSSDVRLLLLDHEGFTGEDITPLGLNWRELVKLGVRIRAVSNIADAKPWAQRAPEPVPVQRAYVDPYSRYLLEGWEYLGSEASPHA